uniref:SMP domain-containing protein n=1 Tax=Oryza barthii TaxID=65489 RepID=A0A0D3F872_9ORYZ
MATPARRVEAVAAAVRRVEAAQLSATAARGVEAAAAAPGPSLSDLAEGERGANVRRRQMAARTGHMATPARRVEAVAAAVRRVEAAQLSATAARGVEAAAAAPGPSLSDLAEGERGANVGTGLGTGSYRRKRR